MEVVNRLPRPTDPDALMRLVDAQRILCSRCVSEEDCERAQALLEELARPAEAGGFGYFPALLTLASLHEVGFEPAIAQDGAKAARYYLELLMHEKASGGLAVELLDEAATQLCSLVKEGKAALQEQELGQLQALAGGNGSGAAGSVSSWARFAAIEAERQLQEAREDPAVREQRLARKKAREEQRAQELARQQEAAREALSRAEDLRQQGNDDYRQGQMPGNARARQDFARAVHFYACATDVLSECLSGLTVAADESNEVRRQRGILHSNAAQVQLMVENWFEAAELAKKALQDDPEGVKPAYRLAKAQVGLGEWEDAARTTDGALSALKGKSDKEFDAMRLELWKLAEEISKTLPAWQWSSSKPVAEEKKAEEDYERRLVGTWEYGPPGSGQCYDVVLTKWGALLWKEKEMQIDLLRKSKLRWRGEYEMISGMVLILAYEPGSDVLMTEFIPPPDVPEEHRWKGPSKFTARRVSPQPTSDPPQPDPEPPPSQLPDPIPPPSASVLAAEGSAAAAEEEAALEVLPESTPQVLWIGGPSEVSGRYELLPDASAPGSAPGRHAVYRRSGDGEVLFLWYRGGNWGVTASLNSSSLAAPFLARCPDTSGRTRHPMEVRRPRWYLRKGRGQEDLAPGLQLCSAPVAGAAGQASGARAAEAEGERELDGKGAQGAELPAAVIVSGRSGAHSEVNGRYELSASSWAGRPVYTKADQQESLLAALDLERPLALFFDHDYWVIAREVSSLPRALARRRQLGSGAADTSSHPADGCGAAWEFLCDEARDGHLVSMDTRKYMVDRGVGLQAVAADGGILPSAAPPAAAPEDGAPSSSSPPARRAPERDEARAPAGGEAAAAADERQRWVASASAEAVGEEVRVSIVMQDGVGIDMQGLSLDVAQKVLKVALAGYGAFELGLPAAVDAGADPKARWTEKTRTLRVRLSLAASAPPPPAAEGGAASAPQTASLLGTDDGMD